MAQEMFFDKVVTFLSVQKDSESNEQQTHLPPIQNKQMMQKSSSLKVYIASP